MSHSRSETRHAARERAFQVLYGLCFAPVDTISGLEDSFRHRPGEEPAPVETDSTSKDGKVSCTSEETGEAQAEPTGFAWELVKGVWKNSKAIDEILVRHSRHWRVDRMGKIELTILRIGIYELCLAKDVPPRVAMDEAVELTKTFAGDNAVGFVNGVLDAAGKENKD